MVIGLSSSVSGICFVCTTLTPSFLTLSTLPPYMGPDIRQQEWGAASSKGSFVGIFNVDIYLGHLGVQIESIGDICCAFARDMQNVTKTM